MKRELEKIQQNNNVDDKLKQDIGEFLASLRTAYDHLDVRQGGETVLGNSIVNGSAPSRGLHKSIQPHELVANKAKDAQMAIKYAENKVDLYAQLKRFEGMELSAQQSGIVGPIASSFLKEAKNPRSLFNQERVFHQVNRDLGPVNFRLKINQKEFKDAQAIYTYLSSQAPFSDMLDKEKAFKKTLETVCKDASALSAWYERIVSATDPYKEIHQCMEHFKQDPSGPTAMLVKQWFRIVCDKKDKKQEILRLMCLLQQGARASAWGQLKAWLPVSGTEMDVLQKKPQNGEIACIVDLTTGDRPIVEIAERFELVSNVDNVSPFYQKDPYAILEAKTRIDYHADSQTVSCKSLK